MPNKKFIHALELSIMLGLSASSFAYAAPDTQATKGRFGIEKEAYTHAPYNKFSITANLIPESSRWYIQANATTRFKDERPDTPYTSNNSKKFTINKAPYLNENYVVFPDIVKMGVPILAPALEVGINKMVHRRLRKTAKRYGPYLEERQLASLLALNGHEQIQMPILDELDLGSVPFEDHDFLNSTLSSTFKIQNSSATQFDFNQSDDMESVLAYYSAAKENPSVRVSGELGYKSERLNWRFGAQKQKLQSVTGGLVNEQNINMYSALDLKISERMTYFNVTAHENSKNSFGIDNFSTNRKTNYHRLNYNISDEFSVFAAQGKIRHDLLGKTQSTQIGVKNCWASQKDLSLCASLGHQSTKYSTAEQSKTAQDGSGYMALMTFKVVL